MVRRQDCTGAGCKSRSRFFNYSNSCSCSSVLQQYVGRCNGIGEDDATTDDLITGVAGSRGNRNLTLSHKSAVEVSIRDTAASSSSRSEACNEVRSSESIVIICDII